MAEDTFELEVATPERLVIRERVHAAQIPCENGMIGVLPQHAALLSELGTGELSYTIGAMKHSIVISGGWVEVRDNHVRVLTDRAERFNEIDTARARQALERALERLAAPATAGVDVARALNAMKRAEARLAAAGVPARGR